MTRLVVVTWYDSKQTDGSWKWLSEFEPRQPIRCMTVGWLIQDDNDVKVIAQTMGDIDGDDDDMQYAGDKVIPTCAVIKIETLREVAGEERQEAAE